MLPYRIAAKVDLQTETKCTIDEFIKLNDLKQKALSSNICTGEGRQHLRLKKMNACRYKCELAERMSRLDKIQSYGQQL